MPIPAADRRVAPEQSATAVIEALDYGGRGVAHVDGKAVFIDGALPGEQVRFRYRRKRRRYDTGVLIELLSTSSSRVSAPCNHFGTCGGCSLQHLQTDAQIIAKERVLREQLRHIGKVEPQEWLAPVRGPLWAYRRKARLGVRFVEKKGGVLVGFRERRRSLITPLADCKTLDSRFARLLPALRELIGALSCPARIPQIELAAGDEQAALVFRHLEPLTDNDHHRLAEFGQIKGVQVHLQPQGPDSVQPLWPAHPAPLSYALPAHNVEIAFLPTDFTQVNAAANRQMVDQALSLLALQPSDTLVDLYCGLGNFTLPAARRAARVIGIDGNAGLLHRAADNAARNELPNAIFSRADLDDQTVAVPWGETAIDKLLLDPPRTGAMAVIKRLPAKPPRIVYVSCYPATLARDAGYLVQALGYRLHSAGVVDMFPQTSHMESMALFIRN